MAEPTFRKAENNDADAIAVVGAALWDELGAKSGLPGPMTAEGVRSRMAEWGERGESSFAMTLVFAGSRLCRRT